MWPAASTLAYRLHSATIFSVSLGPHSAADALPSMLLQLLHVAVLLEPGLAYFSIHAAARAVKAGSNELLAWLDLLQLLLVPLGVPLHLVVDRAAHSADHHNSVDFAAHGRNAAVAFLSTATGSGSSSSAGSQQQHNTHVTAACQQQATSCIRLQQWQAKAHCPSPGRQPWQQQLCQQQQHQCKRQHPLWQLSSQQTGAWLLQA